MGSSGYEVLVFLYLSYSYGNARGLSQVCLVASLVHYAIYFVCFEEETEVLGAVSAFFLPFCYLSIIQQNSFCFAFIGFYLDWMTNPCLAIE